MSEPPPPPSDPGPYQWRAIGGHLALDLCNTMSWRLDPARRIDRLSSPALLADWFEAVSPAPHHEELRRQIIESPGPADTALGQVRDLRESFARLINAYLGHGAPAQPDDITRIAAAQRAALAVATPSPGLPLTWTIEPDDPGLLAHTLALSVAELAHQPDLSPLRRCDGDGCGWFFLDTTRNHSRRWCDPLDCGNRARVRTYTERRRYRSAAAT